MSRKVPATRPSRTILIVPSCSTTYSVAGSPGAPVTSTGSRNPEAIRSKA